MSEGSWREDKQNDEDKIKHKKSDRIPFSSSKTKKKETEKKTLTRL